MATAGPHAPLRSRLTSVLTARAAQNRLRVLTPTAASHTVDFSSNDYLSFAKSSILRASYLSALTSGEASHDKISSTSSSTHGPASSRLLDGNSAQHERLEHHLATFFRAPSALLFNSGFDANVSIFTTLPDKHDWVVFDADIHASVHDGLRASRTLPGRRRSFKHNDLTSFKSTLAQVREQLQPNETVFVALESLYSMSGQFSSLRQLLDIADALLPKEQTCVVLDEAHSTGLVGAEGRGWAQELGVDQRIAVRLATFGKAMSAQGAVVMCDELIRQYLINYARPLIYSTTLPHYALAAIQSSLDHLTHAEITAARRHLHHLARTVRRELELEDSISPIVPYVTPHAKALAAHLQRKDFCVRAVVWPTVERGSERVRICLHAGNSLDESMGLVREIQNWERERKQQQQQPQEVQQSSGRSKGRESKL